jgi:hypothetical protein
MPGQRIKKEGGVVPNSALKVVVEYEEKEEQVMGDAERETTEKAEK